MNKQIDTIKKTRLFLLDLVKDLSVDELNEIPSVFNNNIVWNLGHLIAAQQSVCYLRAGEKPAVDEKYIAAYKPGTKPEQYLDDNELSAIKNLLLSSLDQFETDYQNNMFEAYNRWTTRYGVELVSIDEAIQFLAYHEGLHSRLCNGIKKTCKKIEPTGIASFIIYHCFPATSVLYK